MSDFTNLNGQNEFAYAIPVSAFVSLVESRPGITTPEVAEHFNVSVQYARWAVHQIECVEFYDGNHIRII